MLAYSGAQFMPPLAQAELPDRLAVPIVVANVANVTWLLLWHSLNIYLTVLAMLVLLASLVSAYLIARGDAARGPLSTLERWAVRAPLGLYLGWVSVATIANISGALYAARWDGWLLGPQIWSVSVLVVGAALALAALLREGDCIFAGVFVWAFVGIAVATPSAVVSAAAGGLALVVMVALTVTAVGNRRLV
jgi:hypothetical protein